MPTTNTTNCLNVCFSVYFSYLNAWKQKRQPKPLRLGLIPKIEQSEKTIFPKSADNLCNMWRFLDSYFSTCYKLRKTFLPCCVTVTIYFVLYTISVQNLNDKILASNSSSTAQHLGKLLIGVGLYGEILF